VRSVSDCGVAFEVGGASKQAAGGATYNPCKLAFGAGMDPGFLSWVSNSVAGNAAPKDVSVVQVDASGNAVAELRLANAQITSFAIPALDGAATAPLFLEVTIKPTSVERVKGGGKVGSALGSKSQKTLLVSRYRLTIPGLEQELAKTSAIDGWSVTTAGGSAKPDNLSFTVGEPVNGLDQWLDDLMKGRQSPPKQAKLELLDQSQSPAVEISFQSAGIAESDLLSNADAASNAPARRRVSLWVEGPTLKFN
jgi:hypothetical protein